MFSFFKKMIWTDQRADIAAKEALDILNRYQRFGGYERHEIASTFEYTKTQLEIKHGEIDTWGTELKAVVAEQILEIAKEAYGEAPYGACGTALFGLYLEAQALPGDKATRLVYLINEWHRRAVAAERKN
jgi:hypothetical protein